MTQAKDFIERLNQMHEFNRQMSKAVGLRKSNGVFLHPPFVCLPGEKGLKQLLLTQKHYQVITSEEKSAIPYKYQNGNLRKCRINQPNPLLRDICFFISEEGMVNPRIIYKRFDRIPERTLRYNFDLLVKRKWIIKALSTYQLNPLLDYLCDNYHYYELLDYAMYSIDFHKLLCIPLYLIEKPVRFGVGVAWQSIPRVGSWGLFPSLEPAPKMRPVFHAILLIYAEMPDGLAIQTFLPVNYHYDFLKTRRMRKRIIDNHLCFPCDWNLFGGNQTAYYSGFSEGDRRRVSVHFDRSITLMFIAQRLEYELLKRPYERAIKKWNGSEFIECTTEDTIKRLFTLRFKDGYLGSELFSKMRLAKASFERKKVTREMSKDGA
jgi:hypothetical protein